jgi:FMN hydrolase / 5-amino-6-(5-phospho-D-ribitylamino)uracil phosphatase
MPPLITTDVCSTLGRVVGPGCSTTEVLMALVPATFPRELVARTVCRVLHRAPELSEEVIREVCDELFIDRERWPEPWPDSRVELFDETLDALAQLHLLAPVVAVTNLSVTAACRVERLGLDWGKYLSAIYPSYQLGACKPAGWVWRYVADQYDCHAPDVIHLGDRWAEDVLGPLGVGARVVWINRRGEELPDPSLIGSGRLLVADTLADAVDGVEMFLEETG